MAGSRLLTKILADFLFSFYLLNQVLKPATKYTQQRNMQDYEKHLTNIIIHTF
jgi:hypothetical protein